MSRETAVGLSGLILGVSIAGLLSHLPGNSTEWAAWAQAIGTVAVVVGAVWVAYYQVEHARRSAEERERALDVRAYGLLMSIAVQLHANAQALAHRLSSNPFLDPQPRRQQRCDEFSQLHVALLELPVHVLPDFTSVALLLEARQLAADVLDRARGYAKAEGMFTGVERDPAAWKALEERAMFIVDSLSDGIKRIKLGLS
ncbi:hypothetical protein [Burkholderia stagnalis]